jgi:hypothetical protein
MDQDSKKLRFHYQKANLFRVIHADGAWGGLTPDLQVFFSLFNTRPPIPQVLGFDIQGDGMQLEECPEMTVSKDGLLREVEVGVVMSPENVKALIDFLRGRLEAVEQIKSTISEKQIAGGQGKK